ncbi:MAG: hypothetical protein K2O01_08025 [Bacteroidales bacterium]|nr:hypothetical protein [Bacteroidales bacterium]
MLLSGVLVAGWLLSSACRRTRPSVERYRFELSGLEAWYPLDESRPDPDSLSGLRVALQADWVAESPYGREVAGRINARLIGGRCGLD